MDPRVPPFRYRLEPVLKVDQWQLGLLDVELRRARHLVDDRQRLHAESLRRIEQVQDEMRDLHRDQERLPIERRRLIAAYLQEQYTVAQRRRAELAQAEQLFEQILAQRLSTRQKIRALENHRDRVRHDHDTQHRRTGFRDADDLWLNARR